MSIGGTLNKAGLDSDGYVLKFLNLFKAKAYAALSLLKDNTSHAATNQTTDGISVTIPAKQLKLGRSLRVTAAGTITGANATKAVKLYLKDGVVATLTFPSTAVGNFMATFIVSELTDYAHQRICASGICGTNAGATGGYACEYQAATKDLSVDATLKTQVVSGNAGDTITQTMALIELLP